MDLHVWHAPSDVRPDVQIVRIAGEIDAATVVTLDRTLREAAATGARHLVLDLSAVSFLDSSGLVALLQTSLTLAERDGVLTCSHLSSTARRVLEVSGSLQTLTRPLPAPTG